MKKTILKSFAFAAVGSLMMAGSAMALPWDGLGGDYVVSTSMDYWSPTDFTTNATGNSWFQLQVEEAGYESAFGLYTVAGGIVDQKFEIFAQSAEPTTPATVTFWDDGGAFKVTTSFQDDNDFTNDNWVDFDNPFGFYFDVNQGYSFYTDSALNTQDMGVEHITTAYSANNKDVYIYLDDQLSSNPADADWNDMTVFANDLQPVPEPTTMLLFGTGLIGLAGVARRKKTKNS